MMVFSAKTIDRKYYNTYSTKETIKILSEYSK